MNLTMNRAELLSAVRRGAAIAPSDSPIDVLKGVLLVSEANSGKLTVSTTNLEVALEEKLPCDAQDDDALVVRAKLLAGMLEKLEGDAVHLERPCGSGRLSIMAGSAVYTVDVWSGSSYPRMDIPFPEDTVPVTGIPAMARRTVFAAAQASEKPLLKCVNLRFTKDGLKAVGSDGACVVSARGDDKSKGNINFLIPAVSFSTLAGMVDDKDEFRVDTTGEALVFMKEDFLFSARKLNGNYVDTDTLISTLVNQFTVLTDVQELRGALSSVMTVAPDGKVKLSFDGNELLFACSGECGNAALAVNVIPLTGAPRGDYFFNAPKLKECLRALLGTVTLGIAQGGLLTMATEDAFYMQTAMRPPVEQRAADDAAKAA